MMVPAGANAGGSSARDSDVVCGRMPSSCSTTVVSARAALDRDADDLVGEPPRRPRPPRRAGGSGRPRRPGPAGRSANAAFTSSEDSPMCWPVNVDHSPSWIIVSTSSAVAHSHAPAGPGHDVGGVGHRLHPAGDRHLDLAGADQLVGQGDRGQAGQADLVEGDGRDLHAGRRRRSPPGGP